MGAAMSTAQCSIPSNPDIAGIGVRLAIYIQNLLCFVPAIWAIWDGRVTKYELDSVETHSTTNLLLAFAILISCIVQGLTRDLTNYHASIVLSLSWMNNTNAFIYFLLYIQHQYHKKDPVKPTWAAWIRHIRGGIPRPFGGFARNRPATTVQDTEIANTTVQDTEVANATAQATETANTTERVYHRPTTVTVVFKRVALFMGSLHLTVMSGLGLWLWNAPLSFGTSFSESRCAFEFANIAISGVGIPFRSSALRIVSLAVYTIFLVPGINLILPMALFISIHCWYHAYFPITPTLTAAAPGASNHDVPPPQTEGSNLTTPWTVRLRQVVPVCIGLLILLGINIIFIADIEVTLRTNRNLQATDESEWGFGQILAIVLLFMPLRDLVETIFRRRQELITQLNNELKRAISEEDTSEISRWVGVGADANIKAEDGRCALEVVAHRGERTTLEALLRAGVDIHAAFQDGRCALEVAALAGAWGVAEVLLRAGANANVRFRDGQCALEVVTHRGERTTLEALLRAGVDVHAAFQDGRCALEVAALAGAWGVAEVLLRAGANANVRFRDGQCALEVVTHRGERTTLEALLRAGVDIHAAFQDGRCALEVAALAGAWGVAEVLLRAGANVNVRFQDGRCALEVMALTRAWGVAEALLRAGANASVKFQDGRCALEVAALAHEWVVAEALLRAGANANVEFQDERCAIEVAALAGAWGLVKALVNAGANVGVRFLEGGQIKSVLGAALYSKTSEGNDITRLLLKRGAETRSVGPSALSVAVRAGNLEGADIVAAFTDRGRTALEVLSLRQDWHLVNLLVTRTAVDVNQRFQGNASSTALGLASAAGELATVKALLEKGASVDIADSRGWTPLHYACREDRVECAQYLLSQSANCDVQDKAGATPLHHACLNQSAWQSVQLLLMANADPLIQDTLGETPLHLACRVGSPGPTERLLAHKHELVDARDEQKNTALHKAFERRHIECAKLLMMSGADPDARNNDELTPLDLIPQLEDRAVWLEIQAHGERKRFSVLSTSLTSGGISSSPAASRLVGSQVSAPQSRTLDYEHYE